MNREQRTANGELIRLITLASAFVILVSSFAAKPRNIGPCMPYAERCLHCVDCTQCKHCSVDKGRCSVCFKK